MTPSLQARIAAMRDELVHHRADGYATTTDVLRLLELIDEVWTEKLRKAVGL